MALLSKTQQRPLKQGKEELEVATQGANAKMSTLRDIGSSGEKMRHICALPDGRPPTRANANMDTLRGMGNRMERLRDISAAQETELNTRADNKTNTLRDTESKEKRMHHSSTTTSDVKALSAVSDIREAEELYLAPPQAQEIEKDFCAKGAVLTPAEKEEAPPNTVLVSAGTSMVSALSNFELPPHFLHGQVRYPTITEENNRAKIEVGAVAEAPQLGARKEGLNSLPGKIARVTNHQGNSNSSIGNPKQPTLPPSSLAALNYTIDSPDPKTPHPSPPTLARYQDNTSHPGAYAAENGGVFSHREHLPFGLVGASASAQSNPQGNVGNNNLGLVEAMPVAEEPNLTNARAMDPEAMQERVRRRKRCRRIGCALLGISLLVIAITVGVYLGAGTDKINVPTAVPSIDPRLQKVQFIIEEVFGSNYFDSEQKEKALHWIVFDDPGLKQQDMILMDEVHLIQRYAMVALFFQTSSHQPWNYCNPSVRNQSDVCIYGSVNNEQRAIRWLSAAHECSWMGIQCEDKNITVIQIKSNNLNGRIPSEPVVLTSLRTLALAGNNFTGPIPDWISGFDSLDSLSLQDNKLTGHVPGHLLSMESLKHLWLNKNLLTGEIPTTIGSIAHKSIFLDQNQLTGTIPEEIYSLTQLERLYLSNNHLMGTVSTKIGQMTNLTDTRLFNNNLQGTFPSQFGLLETLRNLYLNATILEGTIPEELYNLKSLSWLGLNDNRLTGSISHRIGQLTNIAGIFLANNQITGTIPGEVSLLHRMRRFHVNGNENLTGSIPEAFCASRLSYENGNYDTSIVADCAPAGSMGLPAVVCPEKCCSYCCNVETGICLEQ